MTAHDNHGQGEGQGGGGRRWAAALTFGLMFAVVAGYYVIHKPFSGPLLGALLAGLFKLAVAGALVTAAGALGRRASGPFPVRASTQTALHAALGLGLMAVAWLAIGASLGFAAWLSWLVLAAALLALRRSALAWLQGLRAGLRELRPQGSFETWLAAGVAGLLALDLLEVVGPPVRFDALVYHLYLPRLFLDAGRLVFDPGNPFWGSPLLVEMNFTWAMSLGGAGAAMAEGLLAGWLALLGLYGLVGRSWPRGAWVAVASLMVGETLWSSLAWGYVDWYAALFGLGVVACLDARQREGGTSLVLWAGVLAGFAMGVKLTAGVVLAGGLVVLWFNAGRADRGKATLAFAAAALAAFVAWPLKNLIATGAPLYPYAGITPWVSSLQQAFFSGTSSANFQPVGPLVPLFATLYGVEGAPGYAASIGPLLLGFSLGVLAGPIRRRKLSGLLVTFVIVGWLAWGGANLTSELLGQSRLYLVIFPAWAALAGLGFSNLSAVRWGSVRLGRLCQAVVLMTMAFSLIGALTSAAKDRPLMAALGLESSQETLARRLGTYAPAMAAVRQLGGQARVVMLWEPRGYYCLPACIPDAWIDRWYTLRRAASENQAILAAWKRQGVGYVLLNRAGMAFVRQQDQRYQPGDWAALDDLVARLELLQRFGDGYDLYAIP